MRTGVVAFALLFGVIAYAHVTDNMGMAHETGIAVGLITGVLVGAFLAYWLTENDEELRKADLFWHKRGK